MPIRSKGEFWNTIIGDSKNYAEKLYKVLSARGFLLEFVNRRIKVLYNNHSDDFSFLNRILKEFGIGRVITSRVEVVPKCADGIHTEEPLLTTDGIAEIQNEVDINIVIDKMSITNQVGFESVCMWDRIWWDFLSNVYMEKVPLEILETYIARYVKGLSVCGLATSMSCDGNHKELGDKAWVDFHTYPNHLFYDAICKNVLNKKFNFEYSLAMPLNKENQYELYYKLNQAGAFLFENRNYFRNIKCKFYNMHDQDYFKDEANNEKLKQDFTEYLKTAFDDLKL